MALFQLAAVSPMSGQNFVQQANFWLACLAGSPDQALTNGSTTTIDLGSSISTQVTVTFGTSTDIASFGANAQLRPGQMYLLKFTNFGAIDANPTSMITPTGTQILCAPGTIVLAEFIGTPGSVANWRILETWPARSLGWSPVLQYGGVAIGGTPSYSVPPQGSIQIIGPMVFGDFQFAFGGNKGTGSGAFMIAGLPVPCRTGGNGKFVANSVSNMVAANFTPNMYGKILGGATVINLLNPSGGGTGDQNVSFGSVSTTTAIQGTFSYLAA